MMNILGQIEELIGTSTYSGDSYLLYLKEDSSGDFHEMNIQFTPRDGDRGKKGRLVGIVELGMRVGSQRDRKQLDILAKNGRMTPDTANALRDEIRKATRALGFPKDFIDVNRKGPERELEGACA